MRKILVLPIIFSLLFIFSISNAQRIKYIFLFLVNSDNYNSISEVNITDINNVVEVSRHYTVPSGYSGNPSRTAIDREGNSWVGNRNTNTLVKIGNYGLGKCVDKNGNGKIDTNIDTNNNGVIDDSEMVYGFYEDECILANVILGEYSEVASFGCRGCHCSGASQGTYYFSTPLVLKKGVRKIRIWCSEAYGGELCNFKFRINGQWVSKIGNYDFGSISGKYASSYYCSGYNFEDYQLTFINFSPTDDWYDNDLWPSCDVCDFQVELVFNLNRDIEIDAIMYWADDSMFIYVDQPVMRQLGGGEGVRAVCVDENNNVYAGMFSEQRMYKVDKNGNVVKKISLKDICNPYGCVVDKNGYVWISCVLQNRVVRYNPANDEIKYWTYPYHVYGISPTADGSGLVINGWESSKVYKIDLDGNIVWVSSGPYQGRGITVDKDDNVYAVGSYYGEVSIYDKNGNLLKNRRNVCYTPTGIGLDYNENIWVACYGDNNLVALDKNLETIVLKTIGARHYVYSDWTGYLLREIVAPPPQIEIEIPSNLFELLALLLSPTMILIVFSAGIGYYAESRAKSGGYVFAFVFLAMLLAFSIFTGLIPLWIIILALILFIGGVMIKR